MKKNIKVNEQYILCYKIHHDGLMIVQESPNSNLIYTPPLIKDYSKVSMDIFLLNWNNEEENKEPIKIGELNGILYEPMDEYSLQREPIDSEDEDYCKLFNMISYPNFGEEDIFHIVDLNIDEKWRGNGFAKKVIFHLHETLYHSMRACPACITIFNEMTHDDDINAARNNKRMIKLFTDNGYMYEKNTKLLRCVINVEEF